MSSQLPHHRLEVYGHGVELLVRVSQAARRLPRGQGPLADQISRAALGVNLAIAEGANAVTPRAKAARFAIARSEAGEVAACAEIARTLGWLDTNEASAVESLATRIAAMLTRLIQRHMGASFPTPS